MSCHPRTFRKSLGKMIQPLTSSSESFHFSSWRSRKASSLRAKWPYRIPRPNKHRYRKLSGFTAESYHPAAPVTSDCSFTLLATLQVSVHPLGTELSYIDNSLAISPQSEPIPTLENNPPNLREQGRLALTFALRKYADVPSEKRISLANDVEEELDKFYVGSQYREVIYLVGGLLAEEGKGKRLVSRLMSGEARIVDLLFPRNEGGGGINPSRLSS